MTRLRKGVCRQNSECGADGNGTRPGCGLLREKGTLVPLTPAPSKPKLLHIIGRKPLLSQPHLSFQSRLGRLWSGKVQLDSGWLGSDGPGNYAVSPANNPFAVPQTHPSGTVHCNNFKVQYLRAWPETEWYFLFYGIPSHLISFSRYSLRSSPRTASR